MRTDSGYGHRRLFMSPDAVGKAGPFQDPSEVTCKELKSCNNVTYAAIYDKKGTAAAVGIWGDVPGTPYESKIHSSQNIHTFLIGLLFLHAKI